MTKPISLPISKSRSNKEGTIWRDEATNYWMVRKNNIDVPCDNIGAAIVEQLKTFYDRE